MRKVWMIAALALLALSASGCGNADRSEVLPSSEEAVMTEPVQSIAPQERTTVFVSESTEISAASTAEPKIAETLPEVSTPAVDRAPLPTESSTTEPAPPKASEPPPAAPTEPPTQETEPSAAEEPAEPEFDIQTWIDYAKAYAESVGLRLESTAVDCWDTPISAGAHCSPERDMEVKINREIRNYTESMFFGLSMRQFIFSVLAVAVAVGLYFLLKPYVGTETVSWMCILGAAPFAALGFITYHGMTAEQFLWAWIRSELLEPKEIRFESSNFYYEALKDKIDTGGKA